LRSRHRDGSVCRVAVRVVLGRVVDDAHAGTPGSGRHRVQGASKPATRPPGRPGNRSSGSPGEVGGDTGCSPSDIAVRVLIPAEFILGAAEGRNREEHETEGSRR
jgi:hypothetical protein